jgi:ABC-2 type transport system ATP-binding protein
LQQRGFAVRRIDDTEAHVAGSSAVEVGDLAHEWGVPLHHLSDVEQSLEQAFIELTSDSVEFHGAAAEVA